MFVIDHFDVVPGNMGADPVPRALTIDSLAANRPASGGLDL